MSEREETDLHHILVEFANAVKIATRWERAEYLQVFHDRIANLEPAPTPPCGGEANAKPLNEWATQAEIEARARLSARQEGGGE